MLANPTNFFQKIKSDNALYNIAKYFTAWDSIVATAPADHRQKATAKR
jgi:hypothetical protein